MNDSKNDSEKYKQAYSGDLTSYAAMYGDSFYYQVDLLGQLIHDKHHPSLGTYKEKLLIKAIEKFLPNRYSVGTGFVIFPDLEPVTVTDDLRFIYNHKISTQLDVIIYDSYNFAPIFKDDDFVVLRPESVQVIIEVKGSLDSGQLKQSLSKFKDYAYKWMRVESNYRGLSMYHPYPKMIKPKLFIMAWMKSIDSKSGKPKIDGKKARKAIVKFYKTPEYYQYDSAVYRQDGYDLLPHLNSLFIYNDCIVEAMVHLNGNESSKYSYGYYTSLGRFQKTSSDGEVKVIGDKTIAILLNMIQDSLEMSQNPKFQFRDKVNNDLEKHEFDGFEPWFTKSLRF